MSNLLKKIKDKELFVSVYSKSKGKCIVHLSRELVNLANKGEAYQREIDNCAYELQKWHGEGWQCQDSSCKGNEYCRAYKAEIIE
jgi:hypothetical protein